MRGGRWCPSADGGGVFLTNYRFCRRLTVWFHRIWWVGVSTALGLTMLLCLLLPAALSVLPQGRTRRPCMQKSTVSRLRRDVSPPVRPAPFSGSAQPKGWRHGVWLNSVVMIGHGRHQVRKGSPRLRARLPGAPYLRHLHRRQWVLFVARGLSCGCSHVRRPLTKRRPA
jgi:hypothetical protein